MLDKGAVVALPHGVEGFVTPKHLVKQDGTQAQLNETLPFKVIEFNKDTRRIFLSHSRTYEEQAREERNERRAARKSSNAKREEAPAIQEIGFNYDYGIFGGSKIGDLTITVLENEVIVENKLKYNTETFRYYDINKVGRYFNDIKTNSDGLKWSEILSNQEAESQKLYNAIPQEVMDLIPTVGGINARVDLDASYKPNEPVIKVPTYIGGANLDQLYSEKLIASGFELNETLSTDGKKAYTKACEVNGVAKTLVVKTFLAEDVLSGSQFLIYPSLI